MNRFPVSFAHPVILIFCLLLPACDLDLTGLDLWGDFDGYGGGYTFTGLTIEPGWVEHVLDGNDRISYQAYWSENGDREPVSAAWSSRDSMVATVDTSGTATARIPGRVEIFAEARGSTANTQLTIQLASDAPWEGDMRLTSVSAGGGGTCGVSDEGSMYCWGSNHWDQIAPVTSATELFVPVGVRPEAPLETVSTGLEHSCGLTADGSAYCWGSNWMGLLGDGTTAHRARPTEVEVDVPLASLHLGREHTCALDQDGYAHCWGSNNSGQLGTVDTSGTVTRPSPVTGDRTFRDLGAGDEFTCGVTDTGDIYCWGRVPMGGGTLLPEPTLVSDQGTFESIGVGFDYVCAVDSAGAAHCFGAQYLEEFFADTPVPLDGDIEFVPSSLSMSGYNGTACALTASGEAFCWGQIPARDGEMISSLVPVPVAGGHRFASVGVGGGHACGITLGGVTLCWGTNHAGQLGTGRSDFGSDEPLLVKAQPGS